MLRPIPKLIDPMIPTRRAVMAKIDKSCPASARDSFRFAYGRCKYRSMSAAHRDSIRSFFMQGESPRDQPEDFRFHCSCSYKNLILAFHSFLRVFVQRNEVFSSDLFGYIRTLGWMICEHIVLPNTSKSSGKIQIVRQVSEIFFEIFHIRISALH